MNYSSAQVCAITGASYRQLDWWARHGKLGRLNEGRGPGSKRTFEPFEAVLVRACVLMQRIVQQGHWDVSGARADLKTAYAADPSLSGWRLVVEADKSYIAKRTAVAAAMVVNLYVAAAEVEAHRAAVLGDPFPLMDEVEDLTELPTVNEWLAAGAPMRESNAPFVGRGRDDDGHNDLGLGPSARVHP